MARDMMEPVEYLDRYGKHGAIAGLVVGIIFGFVKAGIGGAILGLFLGALGGFSFIILIGGILGAVLPALILFLGIGIPSIGIGYSIVKFWRGEGRWLIF